MPVQPWRKGIVTRIQDETYNTKRFWVEVPELQTFDFKAGQFVTLDLPIHGCRYAWVRTVLAREECFKLSQIH